MPARRPAPDLPPTPLALTLALLVASALTPVGCRKGADRVASKENSATGETAAAKGANPARAAKAPEAAKASDATKTDKASAPALVAEASRRSRAGDLGGASVLLERALAADPANRQALGLLAGVLQEFAQDLPKPQSLGLFLRSASALRSLVGAYPKLEPGERRLLPTVFYNEACALALTGEGGGAVRALAEAYNAGFGDVGKLDSDTDLDSLRAYPEFQALPRAVERGQARAVLADTPPAPFDFRLDDPEGKAHALADLKGPVSVVYLWASWSMPCRKQAPEIATLARRLESRGLKVIGLAFETLPGEPARLAVRDALKADPAPYLNLIGDDPTADRVSGLAGYPTTLFLDRTGRIRARLTGYQALPTLEAFAETILDEAKPAPPKPPQVPPQPPEQKTGV